MELIADGGSTKVDWVVLNENKKEILRVRSIGLNPAIVSKEELKKRLIKRNQNSKKEVEERFKSFNEDIKHWNDYDYIIINKNLEVCFKQIENIILTNKTKVFNSFHTIQ